MGRTTEEHVAGTHPALDTVVVHEHHLAVRVDGGDLDAGQDVGAGGHSRVAQGVRHHAHATQWHVPAAGAVPDDVVEEAPVGQQLRIVVEVGEGADQRVRQHHTSHGVVREALRHGCADRLFEQHPPGQLVVDDRAKLIPGLHRLDHGREETLRGA